MTFQGYQKYLRTFRNCPYSGRYNSQARLKINSLDLSVIWDSLKVNGTEAEFIDFYRTNGDFNEEVVLTILDKFPELRVSVDEKTVNQRYQVRVENPGLGPRYKDISLANGWTIDTLNWEDNFLLDLTINKKGTYTLLLRDSIGREANVQVGYRFKVSPKANSDETYSFEIEGGNTPYIVTLTDENGQEVWRKEFREKEIDIDKQFMVKEGYEGQFLVGISHTREDLDKIQLDSPLILKKVWTSTLITILVIFFCLIVLGLLAFLFLQKKKTKKARGHLFLKNEKYFLSYTVWFFPALCCSVAGAKQLPAEMQQDHYGRRAKSNF